MLIAAFLFFFLSLRGVDSFLSYFSRGKDAICSKQRISRFSKSTTVLQSSTIQLIVSASVPQRFSREQAFEILDTKILPKKEYGDRIRHGRRAQGLQASTAVTANDPSMVFTYGEFPTWSMDELIDAAMNHAHDINSQASNEPIHLLDLGSGCGRLVLYSALTRGTAEKPWHIHGIEISDILHSVANQAVDTAISEGLASKDDSSSSSHSSNLLSLHLGAAQDSKEVLRKAQIIFAYSTVWSTNGFSEELCAMIMSGEWSEMLANNCSKGCVVITTDRALDPKLGWELVDRFDVDNREVLGSTGFIHVLR